MTQASGEFDVTLHPEPLSATASSAAAAGLGRFSLDKRYHGALDASASGEMLSAMGAVQGSAGYVALERVDGVLDGRRGSFVLQHSGSMDRGAPFLSVTVVADSGTGELEGLTGKLSIRIEAGKHFYDFNYALGKAV
ncbi:MAG TPA: DUF3224 domain-containing protein [Janthinobacterium sp.]|jgi:hypothetical protein|nr:DUF3224 domain-containing protein [Janthinobacterium sp.]